MKATDLIDNDQLRDDIPDFAPGDELKVHVRVVEGNKERVQVFQGNVIAPLVYGKTVSVHPAVVLLAAPAGVLPPRPLAISMP